MTSHTPFFIIGAGRSGTTLFSKMLNKHPNLAVPPESHFFKVFYPLLPYYGDLDNAANRARMIDDILASYFVRRWVPKVDRQQFEANIEHNDFGGIFDALMRTWAQQNGKSRWGEKTPQHLHFTREIQQYLADAKFVHIYRDGRDVAISSIKAGFGAKTIYGAARRWVAEMDIMARVRGKFGADTLLELSYDDLLDDPKGTLERLCAFLGEDYDDAMLEFYQENTWEAVSSAYEKNLDQPLMRTNKQKWRAEMSNEELRVFEAVAHDMLKQMGYETAFEVAPKLSKAEELYLRHIVNRAAKASAMVRHWNGIAYETQRVKFAVHRRFITPAAE